MSDLICLYITCSSLSEAEAIANNLLELELIACANLLPNAKSLYRWNGAIESSDECILLVKTKKAQSPKITELIKGLHSYTNPCIIELPIAGGSFEYLQWLRGSVT
jgi:periplasmic divalent cation tolerance protein